MSLRTTMSPSFNELARANCALRLPTIFTVPPDTVVLLIMVVLDPPAPEPLLPVVSMPPAL